MKRAESVLGTLAIICAILSVLPTTAQSLPGSPDPTLPISQIEASSESAYIAFTAAESNLFSLPVVVRHFGGWTSRLAIMNAASTPTVATVQFYADAPTPQYSTPPHPIPPYTTWYLDLEEIPELGEFRGSAHVTADGPIVVLDHQVGPGSMIYAGFSAGSKTLYAPLLMADYFGWRTCLGVQNVSTDTSDLQITYSDGSTTSLSLVAHTSRLLCQEDLPSGQTLGAIVTSTAPLAGAILLFGPWPGSAAVELLSQGHTEAYLYHVGKNTYDHSSLYGLQNTSALTTDVWITYSIGLTATRRLGPHGEIVVDQDAEPLPDGFLGFAYLHAFTAPVAGAVLFTGTASPTRTQDLNYAFPAIPTTVGKATNQGYTALAPLYYKNSGVSPTINTMAGISNLGDVTATVQGTFYDETGTSYPFSPTVSLPPGERHFFWSEDLAIPNGRFSLYLVADQPIRVLVLPVGEGVGPVWPDLSASFKAVSSVEPPPRQPVTFTLVLSNGGEISAGGVWLQDVLPTGLSYLSGTLRATTGTYGIQNGVITWTGEVSAGRFVTVTFATALSPDLVPGDRLTNTVDIFWGYQHLQRSVALTAPCLPVTTTTFTVTPSYPLAGKPVTLTAHTVGSEPITYLWTLGDSQTASGRVVTHTYAQPGLYDVILIVFNCGGEGLATHHEEIRVQTLMYLPVVVRGWP